MKGDQVSARQQGAMQGGDIAEAHENFRIAPNEFVIEKRQETPGAVTTAGAEDRFDLRVRKSADEVVGALLVRAGEKAAAAADVTRESDLEAQALNGLGGAVNVCRVVRGAGRGEEGDGVAEAQPLRLERHSQAQLFGPLTLAGPQRSRAACSSPIRT